MVKGVADKVASDGPFEAACILMNSGQYEPFDEELFGPLMPQLKIIGCVNAGYSEFDMDYFNKNKVVVTNTLTAVAEPTADIAIFLMLAALRDTSQKELYVRQGGWREAKTPPTDPNGKTLGIIGMGKIGRVRPLET
jgi:lactate dehydrogenase-like 2-hydroxyacid dehydrogenase